MSLRPYKFIVQAVVQELDDKGNVLGERVAGTGQNGEQPFVLFGLDGLTAWADAFEKQVSSAPEA